MALFSRRQSTVPLDGLREFVGHSPKVLGVGTGPRVLLVALTECLVWRLDGQPWQRVEWHRVRVGGWRQESSEMWWRLDDGSSEKFMLDEEGDFPSAFRDRVQASIAVQRRVELDGRREVLITARRPLSGEVGQLLWDVMAVGGSKLDDPVVKAQVDAELAELRADYDL